MAIAASPNSKANVSSPISSKKKKISRGQEKEIATELDSSTPSSQPHKRNSNPGVRVIGGRIYDSQNGTTCHQCRQKTYAVYVNCKNQAKAKPCNIKYCRTCLLNRYGEKVEDVELLDKWDCPKCKGVCNCSICMKKRGHQPTGMVVQMAKAGGFTSVSDMIDVKGVQNVSNYKRVKETTASPRKLAASAEGIEVKSPKKLGKENLFDGKTDANANPVVSVSSPVEKKPKKVKRKGSEVKLDGSGVNDVSQTETNHTLNVVDGKTDSNTNPVVSVPSPVEKKPKKVKRKGSEVNGSGSNDVSQTETNHTLNKNNQKKLKSEGSKTTVIGNVVDGKTDSNANPVVSAAPPVEKKPKKVKRKGSEVNLEGSGVNDVSQTETNHTINENNQKKLKSEGSKTTVVGNVVEQKPKKIKRKGLEVEPNGNVVNGFSVAEINLALLEMKQKKVKAKGSNKIEGNEKENNTIHDANQHLEDNQSLKVQGNTSNLFQAVIPLPAGTELVTVAGVDIPKEDVGNALQLLEFCSTFGKILDVKKGQAEAVLRDLIKGRSTRRGKFTSVIQFHIQLLSVIQEEWESESESDSESPRSDLTHENDSWLKALKSCISKSKAKHMDFIDLSAGVYGSLESSMKLRLLVFLCDEVLETEKIRNWIDDQNVKLVEKRREKRKEANEKLSVAKDKVKTLKQKMQDEVAKALIAKEGAPLTLAEHDAIISKIRNRTAEAHAEMLACKEMLPIDNARPDAVRTEPIFKENNGHIYWRLKGCSEKPGILLQDIGTGDHTAEVVDRWFEYDDEQMDLIEKHINILRCFLFSLSPFSKCYITGPGSENTIKTRECAW
ncbi:hypothetical protein SSX86_014232 [Deinandra increscens subsp. villosa]|uniref:DDT domain-containing protein n=1 Tax=Deinandra increscens subsp. villosa TaxID=3103831 RepID=A0AAP0D953_9ASTR